MTSILPDYAINPEKKTKYVIDGIITHIWDSPFNTKYIVKNTDLEHTYIISSNSGKDIISYSDYKDTLFYRDANFNNLVFIKNKNNLVIKQDDKNTTTIVNFFNTENPLNNITTLYNDENINNTITNDAYVQIFGNKIINALDDYNIYLKGGKRANKLFGNDKKNILEGGKGDDIYYLKNAISNEIKINKGDGKDTIIMTEELSYDSIIKIYFSEDVDFNYLKQGDDLIIKAYHSNKKVVAESITLKEYFNINLKDVLKIFKGNDIVDIPEGLTILGNKKSKCVYQFDGTDNDDIVTTNKKAGSVVYSGNGNDVVNITSLAVGTIISESLLNDKLNISVSNINNLNFAIVGNNLFISDKKGINSIKKFSTNSDIDILAKNLKGVLLLNYFNNDGTLNETNIPSEIKIIDKNGSNNFSIEKMAELKTVIDNITDYYLQTVRDNGLNYYSVEELLSAEGKTKSEKNKLKKAKNGLVDIYKYSYIGTDSDNNYVINKNGALIYSGKGCDTFTYKGYLGAGASIITSTIDVENKMTDKFVFNNYSFEDHTLWYGSYKNSNDYRNIFLTTVDFNKKGKYLSEHNIIYSDFSNVDYSNYVIDGLVSITDSKRTYSTSIINSDEKIDVDWQANDKSTNHLALVDGKDITIKSNGAYNQIFVSSTDAISTNQAKFNYTYGGGHDRIMSSSECSNDRYDILFNPSTYCEIFDMGGNFDVINLISANTSRMRMYINVVKAEDYYFYIGGPYSIVDVDNMNKNNFYVKDSNIYTQKGVTVLGNIESFAINNYNRNMDNLLDVLGQEVSNWLFNSHQNKWGFNSTDDVLASGNTKAITSLLKVYADVNLSMYL